MVIVASDGRAKGRKCPNDAASRKSRGGAHRITIIATSNQVTANRRNAQASTGPRTAAGKARSRSNAQRHGLAARAPASADDHGELDRIVAALCGEHCDPVLRAQALIIADAQLMIRRVRMARRNRGGDLAGDAATLAVTARLDRYERRALSRRRRAIARYDAIAALARSRGEA